MSTTIRTYSARSRRWATAFFATVITTTLVVAATMVPAQAATMRSGAPMMSAPSPYSYHYGGPIGNMPFTMRCWIDSAWANGTNRWFYGNGVIYNHRAGRFNMQYGYVSAAYVYNQNGVPRCR